MFSEIISIKIIYRLLNGESYKALEPALDGRLKRFMA
jgi:hypothetical protein